MHLLAPEELSIFERAPMYTFLGRMIHSCTLKQRLAIPKDLVSIIGHWGGITTKAGDMTTQHRWQSLEVSLWVSLHSQSCQSVEVCQCHHNNAMHELKKPSIIDQSQSCPNQWSLTMHAVQCEQWARVPKQGGWQVCERVEPAIHNPVGQAWWRYCDSQQWAHSSTDALALVRSGWKLVSSEWQ